MGTKVHCKSYLPGYHSMRDLNEDSSSSSWPFCYGDKPITNGPYYNGFLPTTTIDGYPGSDKDALKQKMLDHEAVFKNQVHELHRLYRIQRDMMEEVEKKEVHILRASMEPSSSSSHQGFPFLNSTNGRKSISGVEIVNAPVSCTKGYNNTQRGPISFQNASTLNNSEALDSRPLKMRKKLFDLQLPADEYIDPEEGENLNSIGLADLNKPFKIEETKGMSRPDKSNAGYLGMNGEAMHIRDGFLMNSSLESKVNERGLLLNIHEAGCSKSNLSSLSRGLQQDKLLLPSHQVQGMLNPIHHRSGIYQTGYNGREDHWREGNHHGLEFLYKSRDHSNNSHLEPLVASRARPGSYPFYSSSSFASSWAQPVSSWAKPTSTFTQKINPFGSSLNSAAATDKRLQTSAQSQEPFGGKWLVNASSRSNPGFGSEPMRMNGFYYGCSSGSKEPQSHLPSSGLDNVAYDCSTNHGFENFQKGSCRSGTKPVMDINLNEVVSKSSSNEDDLIIIDGKTEHEEHLSALPWLKRRPAYDKREMVRDLNQPFAPEITSPSLDCETMRKKENGETQNIKKIFGVPIFDIKNESSSLVSTSESVGCSPEGNNVNKERKKRIIDINLEFEPDECIAAEERTMEEEKQTNGAFIIDRFDLNSCVSDCEDPSVPSYESKTASVKTTLEIDLEAPARLESEDENTPFKELQSLQEKNEITRDEALRDAAEAIFAMSSSCPKPNIEDKIFHPSEVSIAESLLWFVDAISSCANELRPKTDASTEEIDDFEAMTLQLQETKEEDYMPIPFIPEFEKLEDMGGNALPARGRRGHSRRGRQRRDFQRDILPGLASLSRHEVTEDIQTFSGLMRATGHHWNSGLMRRNGTKGARARRRAVVESPVCSTSLMQKLNKIEGGLEERSLTGWGKTTRRPRRQRCPSGTAAAPPPPPPPPTVVLT